MTTCRDSERNLIAGSEDRESMRGAQSRGKERLVAPSGKHELHLVAT